MHGCFSPAEDGQKSEAQRCLPARAGEHGASLLVSDEVAES